MITKQNTKGNNTFTLNLGFLPALALIFITLKLIGIIEWSWVWVLSPLWIIAVLVMIVICIAVLVEMVKK